MESVVLFVVVWGLSALTLTTGVGAGVVYFPVLVVVFGLDIPTAVATSVVVQLAGVGTTALGHRRALNTDPGIAFRLGGVAAFGVVVVSVIDDRTPTVLSEMAFVVGTLAIGTAILIGTRLSPKPAVVGAVSHSESSTRHARDGSPHQFCRPAHGFALAWISGLATGALGVSGAEIQISSLIIRCHVPTRIAIGTGTVASALALASASVLAIVGQRVDWTLAAVPIPAAVVGSMTARFGSQYVSENTLRTAIGILVLVSAAGVAVREILT